MTPPAPSLQDVIHQVQADAPDDEPLTRLRVASAVVTDLAQVGDAVLGYFVDQARRAGHSWSEIGDSLGVSKQAAQQRQNQRISLGPNPPTFERFTPRARTVLAAAEPIAREWGHDHVGTEHLLLALYREPEAIAARVLADAGLPEERAMAAVRTRVPPGSGAAEGRLAFTPRAKAVFTEALTSALGLGHNYIGTEHLLLGLARGEGVAGQVLAEVGISEDGVARAVVELLPKLSPAPAAARRAPEPARASGKGKAGSARRKAASPTGKAVAP